MAESQRQRIGRIIRPRRFRQFQKPFGHIHDLPLFRLAIAGNGHLHLSRRILKQRHTAPLRSAQQHAPAVCHGNAGGNIGIEEQLFNGDHIRLQLADQFLHIPVDLVEPLGQRQSCRCGDGPVGHHMELCALPFDQAEADGGIARVNA